MKLRNGFVSNSSSSSFVVSDKDFPTIRDIAKYMLKRKIKETSDDDDYGWKDESITSDKKMILKLKDLDEDQPVSFPSCNYDTYIRKIGDQYLISTCNNTDWNLNSYSTRFSEKTKEELTKLLSNFDEDSDDYSTIYDMLNEDYDDFYHFGNDYYDLRNEIVGVETFDYCPNVNKHNSYTHLWDTQKFGKICLICNPVHKRKEKLEKINKKLK